MKAARLLWSSWVAADYVCPRCELVASDRAVSVCTDGAGVEHPEHDWRVMHVLVSHARPSLAEHAMPCLFPNVCARCAPLARAS